MTSEMRAPDVILEVRATGLLALSEVTQEQRVWSTLPSIPAVRAGRVHFLNDDFVVVPGPRLGLAAEALARALTAVEEELIQVRSDNPRMFPSKLNTRIGTVIGLIDYADAAPTQALRDLTADLGRRAQVELARLERYVTIN